jgi:hypothetical protein
MDTLYCMLEYVSKCSHSRVRESYAARRFSGEGNRVGLRHCGLDFHHDCNWK